MVGYDGSGRCVDGRPLKTPDQFLWRVAAVVVQCAKHPCSVRVRFGGTSGVAEWKAQLPFASRISMDRIKDKQRITSRI